MPSFPQFPRSPFVGDWVSEKNSSRKPGEQAHLRLDKFVISGHVLRKRGRGCELRPERRAPVGRAEPVVQPATAYQADERR
jgi:hypothetical protein